MYRVNFFLTNHVGMALFRVPDTRIPVSAMHGKNPVEWFQSKMDDMSAEWKKTAGEVQAVRRPAPVVGLLGKLVARGPLPPSEQPVALSPAERLQDMTKNIRKMFLEDSVKYREMVLKEHADQMKLMADQMEKMKSEKKSMFDFFSTVNQPPEPAK
jgi:hypothetical protein